MPRLPVACDDTDGDVNNLPIIFEDLYRCGLNFEIQGPLKGRFLGCVNSLHREPCTAKIAQPRESLYEELLA